MLVKFDHFPNFRGENKQIFELPPPSFRQIQHKHTAWQIWETNKPTNLTSFQLMTPAPCVKNPPVIFQPPKRGPLGLKPCVVASPTSVRHPLNFSCREEEMEAGNIYKPQKVHEKVQFVLGSKDFKVDLLWFSMICSHWYFYQVMAVWSLFSYTRSTKRKSGWHVYTRIAWSNVEFLPSDSATTHSKNCMKDVPSRGLTYPTLGKGKSSSKCHFWGIC